MARSESGNSSRWRSAAGVIGLAVALLGGVVAASWLLHVEGLKTVIPGLVSMKVNTAIGLLLSGAALVLLSQRPLTKPIQFLVGVPAVLVIGLGILTLSEYLVGWNLRIDEWLTADVLGAAETSNPGRMSPASTLCFAFVGIALFAAGLKTAARLRQPMIIGLGAVVTVIGSLALLGFLVEAKLGYHLWNYTGTALHSALAFILLGLGLLALVHSEGRLTWALGVSNTTAFVASVVVMVLAAGSSYNFAKQSQQTDLWVTHTQEVLINLQQIMTDLAVLESSQRGFVITGDGELAKRLAEAKERTATSLLNIRRLTADNPLQEHRLSQLQPLVAQRIEFAEKTIAARNQQGFSSAQEMIASGTGITLDQRLGTLLLEMQAEERTLLERRRQQAESASVTTLLLMPLGLFLSLMTLSLAVFFLNTEIGERSRLEEESKGNQARVTGIVNSAMDAIISVDNKQRILLFNAAAEKMFRCKSEDAVGQALDKFIPERFRQQHQNHVEGFGRTGVTSRSMRSLGMLSGLRSDGEEFPIEASISQVEVDGEKIYTVILRDVTERNRAEEKFRLAVVSAPNAVVMSDHEGHIVMVNEQAEKLFGYTSSELLGQSVDILAPERYRKRHPKYRAGFHSQPAMRSMGAGRDLQGLRKDGSEFPIEIGLTPIHTDDGLLVLSAIVDISERRRAEQKFQLAVESAPNGVVMANSDGRIVLVNAQTEKLFGYQRAELLGQPVEILVPERFRTRHPAYRDKFLNAPVVRSMGAGRDLYGLRKDGSEFPVEIGLTPIQSEEGNLVLSAIVDITERKRAESSLKLKTEELAAATQQLWQSSKLATMGELAASVAHELNNPLATISLRAENLVAQLADMEGPKKSAEVVLDQVERMAALVHNLLQFSRRSQPQISTVDVSEEITNSVDFVAYYLHSRNVEVALPDRLDGLPMIQADRQQLRQLFLNLLTNACDAMPEGGTLTMRITRVQFNAAPAVMIEVTDSGLGISPEHLDQVWDSFFTTKPEGKGTGLGLAICRRIVEEHRGTIAIESELGQGTTVRIILPSSDID